MTAREEVLHLLSGSPELYAYLLTRPEKLRAADYADIIAGAPASLTEKAQLLERLAEHKLLQVLAHIAGVNQTIDVHALLLFVFHVYPS